MTITPKTIAALETFAACPITILRPGFLNIFDSDRIIIVFHTEHGDFRWKVKFDALAIFNAVSWFRKSQDCNAAPNNP